MIRREEPEQTFWEAFSETTENAPETRKLRPNERTRGESGGNASSIELFAAPLFLQFSIFCFVRCDIDKNRGCLRTVEEMYWTSLNRLSCDLHGPDTGQQRALARRIAVEIRAITNILQNLRSEDAVGKAAFDRWYEPFVAEMKADPLLRFSLRVANPLAQRGR